MAKVHKTAIVNKAAELADTVEVGPYCLIGQGVKIGAGTKLGPYCVIHRWTTIGKNNVFTAACSVGADPQDLKYRGEKTELIIGDNNVVREYVTLNRATGEAGKTVIGSRNLFMTQSHVGHNSVIGDDTVMANSVALAGHVVVEDKAVIGGTGGAHQFCRVGRLSITGGCSKITQDVPPYSMCQGIPAAIYGLNRVGLNRAGIKNETQILLKRAFKILFNEGLLISNSVKRVEKEITQTDEIKYLLNFVKASERGIAGWIRSD